MFELKHIQLCTLYVANNKQFIFFKYYPMSVTLRIFTQINHTFSGTSFLCDDNKIYYCSDRI